MGSGPRSIGVLARESGLSVSALRFYDSAGVFRPARVDPVTGYRWYDAEQVRQARLIAALRRVGMPLDDICDVLAHRHEPAVAAQVLDRHLRRLEDGLIDARRHLGAARLLLESREVPMTRLTVPAAELAAALRAVRFAAGGDPTFPALNGVLLDDDGTTLRLVATDRYRLAVDTVPVIERDGPPARAIVPVDLLDALDLPAGDVRIELGAAEVAIGDVRGRPVDAEYPDWERLLRPGRGPQVAVGAQDLRRRVAAGSTLTMHRAQDDVMCQVSVLQSDGDTVRVLAADAPGAVGVDSEFLLEAIDAGGADQLVLALDGPIGPLAIRTPSRAGRVSLLMPTRLS